MYTGVIGTSLQMRAAKYSPICSQKQFLELSPDPAAQTDQPRRPVSSSPISTLELPI
jgi:hypothetical protein